MIAETSLFRNMKYEKNYFLPPSNKSNNGYNGRNVIVKDKNLKKVTFQQFLKFNLIYLNKYFIIFKFQKYLSNLSSKFDFLRVYK